MESSQIEVEHLSQLLERDPYLRPHEKEIRRRFVHNKSIRN